MRANEIRAAIMLTHQTAMRLAAMGAAMARADVANHLTTSAFSRFSESASYCAGTAIERYSDAITAKGDARARMLAGATIRTQALVRLHEACQAWLQTLNKC